jgi:predicted lipid-binding transport protein (Tim44 family)
MPPVAPEPPRAPEVVPLADFLPPVDTWMTTVARLFRRRHDAPLPPTRAPVEAPAIADPSSETDARSRRAKTRDAPSGDSGLERGLRDIHRTDPGFDPSRFVGYAGMVFRDAQAAWMARDFGPLRERVTLEMYGALQAQCPRLQSAHSVNHVEEIEITAVVTEAWQEGDRDYVTVHIGGSMIDYIVDAVSDALVHGSKTIPGNVDEFWTYTRPAGLNFWMLSAIQA